MFLALAKVLLIRHCRTNGSNHDSPLTDVGREQAETLATWLDGRGVDRIVSSPYLRAVDTIVPFATRAGVEVETDGRLRERNFGGSFATPQDRVDAVIAALADYDLRQEGGETGRELVARAWPALVEAMAGPNALTVLIGHRQLNSHLLREIEPSSGLEVWRSMTTPDVFEIWRDGGGVHYKLVWDGL